MSAGADAIRPFTHDDAGAVADLFHAVMRGQSTPAPHGLATYFRAHFLDGPFADPDIPALVYASPEGEIEGFAGLAVQPMRFGERTLRAAILGTLMVRDHTRSPMAGARLLRRILAGPQDVTLSETAGDASLAMWRQLKGAVLDRHSIDFVRVLRPAEFGLDVFASRVGAARLFSPFMRLLDRAAGRKPGPVRWTGLPADFRPQGNLSVRPIDAGGFAALAADIFARDTIVPLWPGDGLAAVVAEAMDKPGLGEAHLCAVATASGKPVGGFLFHFGGKGSARVVDIVHQKGQAGPVLDALFVHARALGAASVQGRTTPQLFDALLGRRALFVHESASVIDTRDPAILDAFQKGDVHFNGLVGERWTRLVGHGFDGPAFR